VNAEPSDPSAIQPTSPTTPKAAEATACRSAQAVGAWTNQAFGAQTGKVGIDFSATPSAPDLDAVIGLSSGAADGFTDLAAIVRFNPDGAIDVRAGSAYRADLSVPYTAGTTYRFHLDVDVAAHTYSVQVTGGDGAATAVAAGYAFRSEQAGVTQLTNLATGVDSSAGALQICDVQVASASPPTCAGAGAVAAGGGFRNDSVGQPGDAVVTTEVVVTPNSILDGVIGLSPTAAQSFSDISAAIRFSASGVIEARDGDTYQADVAVPYLAGEPRRIRIVANALTLRFSAFVVGSDGKSVRFADNYAFRPTTTGKPFLGDITSVVDSASGALALCTIQHGISIGVRSLQDGNFALAAAPGGGVVTSTATATTAGNGASVAAGGQPAVDPNGTVYLARITGSDLVVEAYTSGLAPLWTRSFTVGADQRVAAIGADAASVAVATGPAAGRGVTLVNRWLTDGTDRTAMTVSADAAAIGAGGLVLATANLSTVDIRAYALGAAEPTWEATFQNAAQIDALAIAPNGNVAFAGGFTGPISFGGATLQPATTGSNVYAASLTATGAAGFLAKLDATAVRGIAIDGFTAVAVAGFRPVISLTSSGQVIRGEDGMNPLALTSPTSPVISGSNVVVNAAEIWQGTSYPYLISFDPGV
jgi:hypothetical protein